MSEIQLLDGWILEALNDGEWLLVGPMLVVLVLTLVFGFISWLKGRRLVAILVLTLLASSVVLLLAPLSMIQELVATDSLTLNWALIGILGAGLAIGSTSAIRLARPPSWWAQRRYDNDRYAEAIERHQWTRPQAR